MADLELKCNILTCRKILSPLGKACVTTCSHIFCVDCANDAFRTALICPACSSDLSKRDELVFIELNPSQEYRSSILSGLKPEIIMEICARAISFWTYQASQEIRYQEMSSKACGEKLNAQERQTQIITREFGIEFEALQKEIENEKHKANELAERLEDKSRQLSRLQTLYERERRRPLFSNEILQVHQTQDSYGSVDKDPYRDSSHQYDRNGTQLQDKPANSRANRYYGDEQGLRTLGLRGRMGAWSPTGKYEPTFGS